MGMSELRNLVTESLHVVEAIPDGPGMVRLEQLHDQMEREVWRKRGGLPAMFFSKFAELIQSAEIRLEPAEYRELINRIHQVSVGKGADPCPLPDDVQWALNSSGNGVYRP